MNQSDREALIKDINGLKRKEEYGYGGIVTLVGIYNEALKDVLDLLKEKK